MAAVAARMTEAGRRTPERTRSLRDALVGATDALLAARRSEGCWVDYRLPVGRSDQWVAAFVALRLLEAAPHLGMRRPAIFEAGRGVLARLREAFDRQGGIGFNAGVDPDSDSVAHLVLLGRMLGRNDRPAELMFLARHLARDGGVRTYLRDDAWGASHPCVSAVALRALAPVLDERQRSKALRYVRSSRLAAGSWPSFWWTSSLYATAQMLAALPALRAEAGDIGHARIEIAAVEGSCMEAAWQLECLRVLGCAPERQDRLADALFAAQGADGRWMPSATLRVTDRVPDPGGAVRGGDIYADDSALMTTAICVAALTRYIAGRDTSVRHDA